MVLRAWSMSFRFEISEVTEWMVLERINSNRFEMSRMSGFTHENFSIFQCKKTHSWSLCMLLCFFNRLMFSVIKLFAMLMDFFYVVGCSNGTELKWKKRTKSIKFFDHRQFVVVCMIIQMDCKVAITKKKLLTIRKKILSIYILLLLVGNVRKNVFRLSFSKQSA